MKELELKYGLNPGQTPAALFRRDGGELPVTVLNGRPGYINFLDALHGWQLVQELKTATGLPAAASFKHVSPAGAALGLPLTHTDRCAYFVEGDLTPLAAAYARARGADRLCSYGDWVALSDTCDEQTAALLLPEVSDGVIAPGYTPAALELLRAKRKGGYNVVQIDPGYTPAPVEEREVFGITFRQGRRERPLTADLLQTVVTREKTLPDAAVRDLLVAMITLKYTQSNSVCYVKDGQTIGVGAGQQSRIHCTRLAGDKADLWWLRRHPAVLALPFLPGIRRPDRDNAIDQYLLAGTLDAWEGVLSAPPAPLTDTMRREWQQQLTGVSLGSDAFFPFGDNVERAARSGVSYIAQPGGSIRDDHVIDACDKHGIVMAFTGTRLFLH